jgi:protein gp37
MLDRPLHWRDPRCVFVESMGDLWHPGIPFEFVAAVFGVMAACPQHRFIILTKQARRAREFFAWVESRAAVEGMRGDPSSPWWRVIVCASEAPFKGVSSIRQTLAGASWPLSNVALLVSAWDQKSAERYVPELNACPAAVRGVSAEPLLGPMDLMPWLRCGGSAPALDASGYIMSPGADSTSLLDWVIAGGESGPKARPMQPKWARSLRDQCASSGVPFFFKQWGNWAPDASGTLVNHRTKAGGGRELDGRTWEEFPEAWT